MLRLSGTRQEMFSSIRSNREETDVCILTKPSKIIFLSLLENTKVERIHLSRGIYSTISKKVLEALKKSGIDIIMTKKGAGRPAKFSKEIKDKVLMRVRGGMAAKKISEELGVPTTTIYYWKRTCLRSPGFCHIPDST